MISRGHPTLASSYGVVNEIPLWLGMTGRVDQGNGRGKLLPPPPPSPGFGEARPPSPTVAVKEGELFFQPRILPLGGRGMG